MTVDGRFDKAALALCFPKIFWSVAPFATEMPALAVGFDSLNETERAMKTLSDTPDRYGLVSRILHWGMAALFAGQFLSAAAHWALARENAVRETLWSYHATLGTTLFLLILLRGAWGLANLSSRPPHRGRMGQAAKVGHIVLYLLMVTVPSLKLLSAAGGTRGFSYLGLQIFPPRETEIVWLRAFGEWHGELGWALALLVVGHIAMALVWHRLMQRDDTLSRMAG